MKLVSWLPLVALSLVGSAGALAQNNTPPAHTTEQSASPSQNKGNSGTAPAEMGATGWTGGTRGQTHDSATSTGQGNSGTNSAAAQDQPAMATGGDLKGPPAKFPANKTPE